MRRLGKLFMAIAELIKNPSSILKVVPDDIETKKKIVLHKYKLRYGLPTIDIVDLISGFPITVEPYSFLEGTSSVLDIALLNALAIRYQQCQYLEIGTWRGESVANVSKFAAKCISISLSETEMKALNLSDNFIRAHGLYSKHLTNVEHIGHDSHTYDYSMLRDKFDLIFVDGDHTYQGVKIDTENVFKLLKNEHSVIVWHDYGLSSETIRWDVLAGILDGCPPENRKYLYHVSNTMCAIFIRSEFKTTVTQFPSRANKSFELSINAKQI